jgi:hypothetical protein
VIAREIYIMKLEMALQELGVGREEADLGRHKSHLTHAALKGKTPIETMESKVLTLNLMVGCHTVVGGTKHQLPHEH